MIGKESILIVDDQESNLVALEAILNPLNKTLVRAKSGSEAMKALLRSDFAVVLLDVVMPGMDGFETASHIKRLDQTKDVPIIFLTGADNDPDYTFRGYSVGAVDFLTKPFDPWILRAKVQVFIELDRKKQQLREQADLLRELLERGGEPDLGAARIGALGTRLSAVEEQLQRVCQEPKGAMDAEALKELADRVASMRVACYNLVEYLRPGT